MSTLKKLFPGANDADPENTETLAPEAPQSQPAPEDKGMDEGMMAAMDKCGLDADDEDAQEAFARAPSGKQWTWAAPLVMMRAYETPTRPPAAHCSRHG